MRQLVMHFGIAVSSLRSQNFSESDMKIAYIHKVYTAIREIGMTVCKTIDN